MDGARHLPAVPPARKAGSPLRPTLAGDVQGDSGQSDPPEVRLKFVSIAGDVGTGDTPVACVTPIGRATPPPAAAAAASPTSSPATEVKLLPIELVSFGYGWGGTPKACKRVRRDQRCPVLLRAFSPVRPAD